MLSKIFGRLFSANSNPPTHVDNTVKDLIEEIQDLLDELCTLMPEDQTSNDWRIHFRKMQRVLQNHANQYGLDQAAMMWHSIHGGMGSWNDYYIPHEDQSTMRELNRKLKHICGRLLSLFQSASGPP